MEWLMKHISLSINSFAVLSEWQIKIKNNSNGKKNNCMDVLND